VSSEAEGEEAIKAQTAVHSPEGNAVETVDDYDDLVDYNSPTKAPARSQEPEGGSTKTSYP
jgi:hypothetical protein